MPVPRSVRALAAKVGTSLSRRVAYLRGSMDLFESFQQGVHPATWRRHDAILDWAFSRSGADQGCRTRGDPLVARGWELKKKVEADFRDKFRGQAGLHRILVHVPDFAASPGGYSLFNNLLAALQFVGVPAAPLTWGTPVAEVLRSFRPTCLMTSDAASFLERIDWEAVRLWKKNEGLFVGLTASLEEYGNTPLAGRLDWAAENGVDFYYTFGSREYVRMRDAYRPFFDRGYPMFHLEFGANPAIYFPVDQPTKDLDYIFLASSNPDKQPRYYEYLPRIFRRYRGFIDGPGWTRVSRTAPAPTHRYLYARAKVGINLHIPSSLEWPNELNERTYILAACGIPQVIDAPLLLSKRFSPGCFFVAGTPLEYDEAFHRAVTDFRGARRQAAQALEEVFASHTTYHRVDGFLEDLGRRFPGRSLDRHE